MTENDAIELLAHSILMPDTFKPFDGFIEGSSIAIVHLGTPIILLGPSGSIEATAVEDRLMGEGQFHDLVGFLYGAGYISIESIKHQDCFTTESCHAIVQSTQGQLEYGEEGNYNLIAILPHPNQSASQAFSVGLCISNIFMKCFKPNSIDLPISANFTVKASA